MLRQVSRIEPWLAAVGSVGQGEEAGYIAVSLPCAGQQDKARAIGHGQFAPCDWPETQGVGLPGKVQCATEIGVCQSQAIVAVLHGLGQQLMGVGGSQTEGVKALGMELDIGARH